MGTIRQQIIGLLEERVHNVRDLSQELGISEKEVFSHLEHIQRTVTVHGKRFEMMPCECLSCGFVFKDRHRVQKPGRCPKCSQSHIRGATFRVK